MQASSAQSFLYHLLKAVFRRTKRKAPPPRKPVGRYFAKVEQRDRTACPAGFFDVQLDFLLTGRLSIPFWIKSFMGASMQVDTSASARLLQSHTPMTPTHAESQRILSNMPDPDPCHRINFEWSMKDLEAWSQAEQELKARAAAGPDYDIKRPPILPQGPLMLGGRVWWSAAARFISIAILLIAIVAESLIILR